MKISNYSIFNLLGFNSEAVVEPVQKPPFDIAAFLAKRPVPKGELFAGPQRAWIHLTQGKKGHYNEKIASPLEKKILALFNQIFNPEHKDYLSNFDEYLTAECHHNPESFRSNMHFVLKAALTALKEVFPDPQSRSEIMQERIHEFEYFIQHPSFPIDTRYKTSSKPWYMHSWILPALKGILALEIFAILGFFWSRREQYLLQAVAENKPLLGRLSVFAGADANDTSLLFLACVANHTEMAQLLIDNGANLLLKSPNGITSLEVATLNNNLDIMKRPFRGMQAFEGCQNIHDIAAVLFPPYRDSLPPNWKSVVAEIPDSLSELAKEERFQTALGIRSPTSEEIGQYLMPDEWSREFSFDVLYELLNNKSLSFEPDRNTRLKKIFSFFEHRDAMMKSSKEFPIKSIFETLLLANPIYVRAWELSGQPKIQTDTDNGGCAEVHGEGLGASYQKGMIHIGDQESLSEKLDSLVFETINAVQENSFAFVEKGELDRESYAIGTEWIEMQTSSWTNRILHNQFKKGDFLEYWKSQNPDRKQTGLISHAEYYRKQWDKAFFTSWVANHPYLFQKRLDELVAAEKPTEPAAV